MTPPWQPIDTAPRVFEYDHTFDGTRYQGGPVIKVRGTLDGQTEEFNVHWSQIGDSDPHWFIFDCEPLDWPADEWRPLTAEEDRLLTGDPEAA